MTENPGHGDRNEENLRKLLEELMGGPIPPEALQGLDLSQLAQQMQLPDDPAHLRAAAEQMKAMFGGMGMGPLGFGASGANAATPQGPVNWKLATQLAKQVMDGSAQIPGMPPVTGTTGDPSPSEEQKRLLSEAANIAQLWLSPVLDIDTPHEALQVWGRGTWLNRSQDSWHQIVEPVASYMSSAIGEALSAQISKMSGDMPIPLPGDPAAMMEQMGSTMFAMQFGLAIGQLAREAVGTTDLGVPLGAGAPALIAPNIEDFIKDSSVEGGAVRIFLATRELAHAALFQAAPWLPKALFSAIEDYARGITLDLDALDEMVRGLDMNSMAHFQAQSPELMFTFTRRASQERALEELATTLALIEGWVDHVTTQALQGRLPQLDALRELWRRRRVSGSPAEEALAKTVGIELRPRLAREALAWWDSVLATEGASGRERVWGHPDLLPSAEVLSGTPQAPKVSSDDEKAAEVEAHVADSLPATGDDFDAQLQALLDGEGADRAPIEDEQGRIRGEDDAGGDDAGASTNEPRA